jgi:hypothetical protein
VRTSEVDAWRHGYGEGGDDVDGGRARASHGACLADWRCGGKANGAERGAKGGVVRWSGAWPVHACGRAHDVLGMALGSSGRDVCQYCGASLRLWRVLAVVGGRGGAPGHLGQG